MSNITNVTYKATVTTYAGCSETIELSAEMEKGDDFIVTLNDLKTKVHEHLNDSERYADHADSCLQLLDRHRKLQKQIDSVENYWASLTKFMQAQGIKSDFPDFPKLEQNIPLLEANLIDNEF